MCVQVSRLALIDGSRTKRITVAPPFVIRLSRAACLKNIFFLWQGSRVTSERGHSQIAARRTRSFCPTRRIRSGPAMISLNRQRYSWLYRVSRLRETPFSDPVHFIQASIAKNEKTKKKKKNPANGTAYTNLRRSIIRQEVFLAAAR